MAMWACMAAQGAVRINEVMASNRSLIADEDGEFSDWIELVNTGPEAIPLDGWGLSDDADAPFRWTFPFMVLAPGNHVLIWSSKKDRKPTAVLENSGILIAECSSWKYWDVGTVPDGDWRSAEYDDSNWPIGVARFGATRSGAMSAGTMLSTNAAGYYYPSYFFRKDFLLTDVPGTNEVGAVVLRHYFDDGAILSINGTEVFRLRIVPH